MKMLYSVLLLLGAIGLLIVISPGVDASTNCHATGNWCQGWAQATATSATGSRCFSLRLTLTAPGCATTTSNEAAWDIDGGTCINFYYYDQATGAVPPAVPNKVTIILYNDGGTVISTIRNAGTEQANGSPYSVCAQGGGSLPRSGTYEIYILLVKDDGPAGVGNYAVDSRGVFSGTGITEPTFDKAALRADIIIASITPNAYPSGSTFAYGVAGDESVTITSTFTQANAAANTNIFNSVIDAATLTSGQNGAPSTAGGSTTLAQSFVIDNTFTNQAYVPAITVSSNAVLTGLPWTIISNSGANGANIVRDSATRAHSSTTFNIDPRIIIDSDGAGSFATADDIPLVKLTSSSGAVVSQFNRGETDYIEFFISNARSQLLSRPMTVAREDASATVCNSASLTPTANKYSNTFVNPTSGGCTVINADPGSSRFIRVTNTDQNHLSLLAYRVSSLYYFDAHIELSSTLVKDDFPTENSAEDTTYIISNAQTDTTHGWCHLKGVRKDIDIDTSGSVITWRYVDPLSVVRLTGTTDTGADGWTPTHLDLLASTPLGTTWRFDCVNVSFNGNSGSNIQFFTVVVPGGTATGAFPGDPIKVSCTPSQASVGLTIRCLIAETLIDGTGRTGNSATTNVDIRDATNTLVISNGHPTEWQHGIYYYDYLPVTSGFFSFAVETTDVDTSNAIPGIYAFYVQEAYATSTQVSGVSTQVTGVSTQVSGVSTQVTGVATQVSGVSTQVSNVATQVNEIDVDADEILAGQVALQSNITAFLGHLDNELHNIHGAVNLTATSVLVTTYQNNLTAFLGHVDNELHNIHGAVNESGSAGNVTDFLGHIDNELHNIHGAVNLTATSLLVTTYQNNLTAFLGHIDNEQHNIHDAVNLTASSILVTAYQNNLTAFLGHIDNEQHNIHDAVNLTATSALVTTYHNNLTAYLGHLDNELHNVHGAVNDTQDMISGINATIVGNVTINNQTLNEIKETLNDLASLSMEPFPLLLIAVAFFVILGESRKDVLYWVMALILSIILLIIRPSDSHIPIPFFVGWIFIVLYQLIALLSNGRAVNLGGEGDE